MFETFELLVFTCSKTCPCLIDYVCKSGISDSFLDVMGFPLVSEVFAYLDTFETLVNPIVGVSESFLIH